MSALTVAEVLKLAADLIEPEGAWTQGCLARDENGDTVLPEYEEAICFCGYGAVVRASGIGTGDFDPPGWDKLDAVVGVRFPDWQDAPERTQAEVVAKLREAAALAREQGK